MGSVDNIFIDPTNGHMWVSIVPRLDNVFEYIVNRSHPVENRVIHIALSEEEDTPFSPSHSKIVVSVGVYSNNKLLLGTVGLNFMFCDHFQPSF